MFSPVANKENPGVVSQQQLTLRKQTSAPAVSQEKKGLKTGNGGRSPASKNIKPVSPAMTGKIGKDVARPAKKRNVIRDIEETMNLLSDLNKYSKRSKVQPILASNFTY